MSEKLKVSGRQVCRCKPCPRVVVTAWPRQTADGLVLVRGLGRMVTSGFPSGRFYLGREMCGRCERFRVPTATVKRLDAEAHAAELDIRKRTPRKLWGDKGGTG